MKTTQRTIAATELLLILPAALFMTALIVRRMQFAPARSAQEIVLWYSARPILGLWVFLIAMPLAVLVTGVAAIRAHLSTLFTKAATVAAGCVLAIVGVHMLMN